MKISLNNPLVINPDPQIKELHRPCCEVIINSELDVWVELVEEDK